MLNQLFSNIYWTQRANFIDIPTDCPQRDERLGWTGDAQVYIAHGDAQSATSQAFFTKWLVDLERRPARRRPVPDGRAGESGRRRRRPGLGRRGRDLPLDDLRGLRRPPGAGAAVPLDDQVHRVLPQAEHARAAAARQFHCFGDWLSINADTPKDVIYTAYFAHSTKLTARAAEVLGKTDDAAKYRELFDQIKAAFNRAYVGPDGRIKGNTQACLRAGDRLRPGRTGADRHRSFERAAQYLVEDIEKRGCHLSTGFIGTKSLMLALSKIGRDDVAFRLLHNDTFPSWGFSIKQGATSIWERWDGWTPEKGFQDPGMNSFAHYSFGAVYRWMVENIGGIKTATRRRGRTHVDNYMQILIAPHLDPEPELGEDIVQEHPRHDRDLLEAGRRSLQLELTIPANTRRSCGCRADAQDITESGRPLAEAEGVKGPMLSRRDHRRFDGERVILEVSSGTYRFSMSRK